MGAKSKPQETVSLSDLGVEGDRAGEQGSRTEVYALNDPPARAATRRRSRTTATARRRSSTSSRRSGSYEHARLSRASRRRAPEGLAWRARESRGLGDGDVAGVSSAPACGRSPTRRASTARRRSTSQTTRSSRRRCRSLASTCSRSSCRDSGIDTVLFGNSVLAADVAAGLAARLDAGLNWDLTDLVAGGRQARRQASGAAGLGVRRRRLDLGAAARALPLRLVRPDGDRRFRGGRGGRRSRSRTSPPRRAWSSRRTRRARGPSIEDAPRDRRRRARARRPGELHARRGAREGARRRGRRNARRRRRGLVPVLDPGRADRQDGVAEALHRRAASPARSSTRSGCRARA